MSAAVARTPRQEYLALKQEILEAKSKGMEAFVILGVALKRLRDNPNMYQAMGYPNFETCLAEDPDFRMKATYAGDLIRSSEVRVLIGKTAGSGFVWNEWQARPLQKLLKAHRKKIPEVAAKAYRESKDKNLPLTQCVTKHVNKALGKKSSKIQHIGTPTLEKHLVSLSKKADFISERLDDIRKTKGAFGYLRRFVAEKQQLANALGKLQRALESFERHLPEAE